MVRARPNGREAFLPVHSNDDALVAWLASGETLLRRDSAADGGFNSVEPLTDRLSPSSLPMDSLDMAFAMLGVALE
jgi:hypothetical protein